VRGILDAQGHPKFGTNIKLANADEYQGQWNTITVTQTWGKGDAGAMKVVFNGKTVVDCTCDNSMSHSDYKSDDAEYGSRDLGYVFAFGIHRFLAQADKFTDVVDPIVYYKDVSVTKH
jgi:major membrane immunogen (membrane-anchored lipoprotein)